MNQKPELFYCYEKRFKEELINKNFIYLHTGLHMKTKSQFWVFYVDDKLKEYLSNRKRFKPEL